MGENMPLRKNHNQTKKYLFMAIIILLIILMIVSFSPKPEMTEIVLFP